MPEEVIFSVVLFENDTEQLPSAMPVITNVWPLLAEVSAAELKLALPEASASTDAGDCAMPLME